MRSNSPFILSFLTDNLLVRKNRYQEDISNTLDDKKRAVNPTAPSPPAPRGEPAEWFILFIRREDGNSCHAAFDFSAKNKKAPGEIRGVPREGFCGLCGLNVT